MTAPKKPAKRKPLVAWVHVHRRGDFYNCREVVNERPEYFACGGVLGSECLGWLRFREVRR